jgi:hypothetical protein
MKKIFLFIAIALTLQNLQAQTPFWVPVNNYQKIRGVWSDSIFKLPLDTTRNKDAGSLAYKNGGLYLKDATKWNLLSISSSGVISFNGRTGIVVPNAGDYNLSMLGDVAITDPTDGQQLVYNSTTHFWENKTVGGGDASIIEDSVIISLDGLHSTAQIDLSHTGFKNIEVQAEDQNATGFLQSFNALEAVLEWQAAIKGQYKFYITYYY